MTAYQAPVRQMRFAIEHLADFPAVAALPVFSAVDGDTIQAVLDEAAKFAGGVLAPINWLGDQQGVKVVPLTALGCLQSTPHMPQSLRLSSCRQSQVRPRGSRWARPDSLSSQCHSSTAASETPSSRPESEPIG